MTCIPMNVLPTPQQIGAFNPPVNAELLRGLLRLATLCGIPCAIQGDHCMICSPVGNQRKFSKRNKAQVAVTGFCTAPDAVAPYLTALQNGALPLLAECSGAFNTVNMQTGMIRLLESLGVADATGFHARCIDPKEKTCVLYTQTLCMIAGNGSANSSEVSRAIPAFLPFAEASLTNWYKRIDELLENKGLLIVMGGVRNGATACLLKGAVLGSNGNVTIRGGNLINMPNCLWNILGERYQLIPTYHPSALNRANIYQYWKANPLQNSAFDSIQNFYRNKCRDENSLLINSNPYQDASLGQIPDLDNVIKSVEERLSKRTIAILEAMREMGNVGTNIKTDKINFHPFVLFASRGAPYWNNPKARSRHQTNVNATLLELERQGKVLNVSQGFWQLTNAGAIILPNVPLALEDLDVL